jgi:hypothetical protein
MTPEAIVGTISSAMFAFGNVPMLVKAVRTRNLASYSQVQLTLVGTANVFHWFYISSLPFGPIWFLHSFHTVATAVMLFLYFRHEVRVGLPLGRARDGLRRGCERAVSLGVAGAVAVVLALGASSLRAEPRVFPSGIETAWLAAAPGYPWRGVPVGAPRTFSRRSRIRGGLKTAPH